MNRRRCTLLAFLSIFLLSTLLGCKESFEVNHSEDLSIESANDGSGTVFSSKFKSIANGSLASNGLQLEVGDTFTYYVVKRLADGTFKESTLGEWFSSNSSVGTAAWTASGGKSCVFTALAVGTTELKVVNGLFASKITVTVSAKQTGTSKWDFATPSDYTFVSQYIDISGGKATLKTVDSQHEGFTGGTHVGTYLDSNNNLTLQQDMVNKHVNQILPNYSSQLIAYMRFDGNLQDSSNLSNNGTAENGASTVTTSMIGSGSLDLNGTNQSISLANESNFDFVNSDSVTFSLWFKPDDLSNNDALIIKRLIGTGGSVTDHGFSFFISGNRLYYRQTDGAHNDTFSAAEITTEGVWYHLAATVGSGSAKVFINGVDKTAGSTLAASSILNDHPVRIGYDQTAARRVDGLVDEVSIWSTKLTDSEIQSLYQTQSQNFTELSSSWTPYYSNIVGYWKMDGNWQDSSGNGNHGTANGAPSFGTDSIVGSQSGSFPTDSDHADISDDPSLNLGANGTILAWIKGAPQDNKYAISQYVPPNRAFIVGSSNSADGVGIDKLAIVISDDGSANPGSRQIYYSSIPVFDNSWHQVGFTFDSGNLKLFIDGREDTSVTKSLDGPITTIYNSPDDIELGRNYTGQVDDVAIFNSTLLNEEIATIYNRQKQKYAGHYESPVIDLGQSGNWTNLNPKTTLPFYKEIATASESSSDYNDLSGDLGNGLLTLWKMNETSWSGGANEVQDSSGGLNHGVRRGDTTTTTNGILANAGTFDGTGDYLEFDPHTASFEGLNTGTISLWMKSSSSSSQYLYALSDGATLANIASIQVGPTTASYTDEGLTFTLVRGGSTLSKMYVRTGEQAYLDGNWHHIVLRIDGVENTFFVDGAKQTITFDNGSPTTNEFSNLNSSDSLRLGSARLNNNDNNGSYTGEIDELAVWNRGLSDTEIQQLYRRGANRIKYQVKSCVDSNCNCKSFGTGGTTNDCDGDSTPNSAETVATDIHLAEWIGKNGSGTEFSEIVNCTTPDGSGDCSASKASKPDFSFASYPAASRPANNRYFQYKVLMEAEENTLCTGSAPCMPELESIEVGPTSRFYGGAPVVASKNAISYSEIQSLSASEGGSCSIKYQLSPDNGTTYYYWNGSAWTAASSENVSEAALVSDVSANISTFNTLATPGNLHFKAFLESNTSQSCELTEISTEVKE